MPLSPERLPLLAGAALLAGAINSVAGGGSLVSFPAAIGAGLSPLVANATNSVGLTPASLASTFAYRRESLAERARMLRLAPVAALGGAIGSVLLLKTPERVFDQLVPLLVLFATALLFHQNVRPRKVAAQAAVSPGEQPSGEGEVRPSHMVLQLLVAIYGGYFGAGIGIMMLALLSAIGVPDIHRQNAIKTLLAALINGVAAAWFIASGVVDPQGALLIAICGSAGGFVGAAVARRLDPRVVRWVVVAIGVVLTVSLARSRWFA